jgi:hypothetical protein
MCHAEYFIFFRLSINKLFFNEASIRKFKVYGLKYSKIPLAVKQLLEKAFYMLYSTTQ